MFQGRKILVDMIGFKTKTHTRKNYAKFFFAIRTFRRHECLPNTKFAKEEDDTEKKQQQKNAVPMKMCGVLRVDKTFAIND